MFKGIFEGTDALGPHLAHTRVRCAPPSRLSEQAARVQHPPRAGVDARCILRGQLTELGAPTLGARSHHEGTVRGGWDKFRSRRGVGRESPLWVMFAWGHRPTLEPWSRPPSRSLPAPLDSRDLISRLGEQRTTGSMASRSFRVRRPHAVPRPEIAQTGLGWRLAGRPRIDEAGPSRALHPARWVLRPASSTPLPEHPGRVPCPPGPAAPAPVIIVLVGTTWRAGVDVPAWFDNSIPRARCPPCSGPKRIPRTAATPGASRSPDSAA